MRARPCKKQICRHGLEELRVANNLVVDDNNRCMKTKEKQGWNVFKQIFTDHWDGFKKAHPRYNTSYHDEIVKKMLDCGNPEKMGYI